jgi:DnaK suppressor protein
MDVHPSSMDRESIRSRLRLQRAALVRLMEASAAEGQPEPDKTRSGRLTRMDDLRTQAMGAEAVRRRKLELARLDGALRRLESGDYGYCVRCGEAIAPGRLEADLAVEQCIRCATRAEERVR